MAPFIAQIKPTLDAMNAFFEMVDAQLLACRILLGIHGIPPQAADDSGFQTAQPRLHFMQLVLNTILTATQRPQMLKNFAKLREDGRIRRIGPAKGGHWEVLE